MAPIRFKNAQGRWRDVDLDLAALADGTVGPKGHPKGLNLAGPTAAAGKGTASASESDLGLVDESRGKAKRSLVFGWAGRLPAPMIAGTTATYPDVSPGVDVVVSARRTGFEQDIVIKRPAALARLVKTAGAKPVSWSFPVKLNGLTASAQADGSIAFTGEDGTTVSELVAPSAWDAAVDARSGEHTATAPVAMAVKTTGPNRAVVTLTPDAGWLTDPARVFPITIDPTYASGSTYASFDTYVSKAYPTTAYSTSTELRVGTYNGGTDAARSFLTFPLAGILGKDIVSGSLSLYETHSWSCTAKPFSVHYALGTTTSTTWNTQPAAGTQYGSTSAARGYSASCPAGRVNLDVSNLVKWWATTSSSHGGIRLSASETDNTGWKKFASSETATDPLVSYTYNRKPNAATVPVLQAPPANSYQAPGSSTAMVFTSDSTPTLSASATDPDASKVNMTIEVHSSTAGTAASKVTTCTTGLVASGGTGSCTSATALGDSTTYYARTAVVDERGLWNGTWSPWRTFYTSFGAPPTPTITCPAPHANNAWQDDPPAADVTCTIAAPGTAGTYLAPGYVDLVVDGLPQARRVITASNDPTVAKTTVTFSRLTPGAHTITATAFSRSLRASTTAATYGFGWGGASMSYPTPGTASSGTVKVAAEGPPRGPAPGVSAKLRWRVAGAGDETSGWTDGPTLNATAAASTDIVRADGAWDVRTAVRESGASADLPARTPILFDVQVCFTYTGVATAQCTWSQAKSTLTRVPHAFGAGYPVADAGPGQVALFTGEVAMSGTDVSVPGYGSDITLSRSHVSFDGDGSVAGWPTDPVTGVFGPGWTANLQGPDGAGLAGMGVLDNTRRDGTIAMVDEAGEPLVFQNPALTRAYATAGTAYTPVNDAAIDADLVLKLAGTGAATTMTVTEPDGTTTTWQVLAAPVPTADTQWKPVSVTEPGAIATTFTADSGGRVTRMVSAAPGLDCSATLVKGCRAVDITYATTTTATTSTPGDYTGRVSSISATLWNPASSAMATTVVAAYAYDTAGRLVRVRDPRTDLGTDYGWDGTSTRIASITPTGLSAYRYSYDTATNPSAPKLSQVSRDGATSGAATVTLARYVYGLATSGTGLPDVSVAAVGDWYQAKPATQGFAVFGQDYTGPVTGSGVDYSYADLSYTDADGYTVNTASYGAGTWLITATDNDQRGNTVRTLDATATARAVALKAQLGAAWSEGQADALASLTIYNNDITNAAGTVLTPAGTLVTDTYGPTRNATLSDGTVVPARPHTHTSYDAGAPNNGINPATSEPYRLPTTITTAAATAAGTDLETLTTVTNTYDPVVTNDGDGWAFGAPTQVTTGGPNGLGGTVSITRTSRFDPEGRSIETRQPLSTGSDAGTTRTSYYTVDANTTDPACGNHAEWAGLVCRTYPAAAPNSGPTLPDERTTAYSMWLHPTEVIETSGTSTRTTTTGYDTAERVLTSTVTASGITGSTPRPGTYTHYRASDGLIDYRGALNTAGDDADPAARTSYGYDLWGRATSYTNDLGDVTTTSYGSDGRLASVSDPLGTSSYAYTALDANSQYERRGLPTQLTITRAGSGGSLEFKAAYNANGQLVRQNLPGQVTARTVLDEAGEAVGLSYTGQVTPVTETVDPTTGEITYTPGTPQADQPWLTWTQSNDVVGRVRADATGAGAGFDGVPGVSDLSDVTAPTIGEATGYARSYTYDAAGRLTQARDNTSDGYAETTSVCSVRTYGFDGNGRRSSVQTVTHPDGDCASTTATTTTTSSYAYDSADRPTTGANGTGSYGYDTFGRQTTLPAADAPDPAAGNITLGYYHDDLPKTITQNGTTTTFDLDSAGRRLTATTTGVSTDQTLVRHYGDDSDNPAWTVTTTGGTATTERQLEALGGGLGATITTTGDTTLPLASLHGDIVTTIPIPAGQSGSTPAGEITGWTDYSEYGAPRTTPANYETVTGTTGYGWLGTHQRSSTTTQTVGLTLMGVRLYNPARGAFTTVDPISGGNENAFSYPNDPLNAQDIEGTSWNWARRLKNRLCSPTSCLFFKKENTHFVMRDGRPGFHWKQHSRRVEWDRKNGWHLNKGSSHYRLKNLPKWVGTRLASATRTYGRKSLSAMRAAARGAGIALLAGASLLVPWSSFVPPVTPTTVINRRNRYMDMA